MNAGVDPDLMFYLDEDIDNNTLKSPLKSVNSNSSNSIENIERNATQKLRNIYKNLRLRLSGGDKKIESPRDIIYGFSVHNK
jgi:thymidylate kinase